MSQIRPVSQPLPIEPTQSRLRTLIDTRRQLLVILAALMVFCVSFGLNLRQVHLSNFHPDESRWINRASYISNLKHPLSLDWGDAYLLRGQPPFGSYITGLGLLLQGQDTSTNNPFDFNKGNERNITWEAGHNAIPSEDDLIAARQTNAFIGAVTAALIVVILAKFTNLIGATLGGLFLAVNSLQEYLSSTALSDATLGLLLVLSTLAMMRLVRKPSWLWTVVLGLLLGCGMAAKLSPIALAIGFAGMGGLFLIRPLLMKIPGVNRVVGYLAKGREAAIDRLSWMFLSLPIITLATFVTLYPYVWSAPYSRTKVLFDFRSYEMKNQARIWPNLKIDGVRDALDRLRVVFTDIYPSTGKVFAILSDHTPFPSGMPSLDIVMVGLGLLLAIIAVIRTGIATPMAFTFYLLGGQTAAIIVGLRVDFNRYYLPILIFGAICFGYFTGEVIKFLWHELEIYRGTRTRSTSAKTPLRFPTSVPASDQP